MTERTPQGLNVMLQSVRECRLTKNQVFRLWKCAVKDDDKLVDHFQSSNHIKWRLRACRTMCGRLGVD